MSPVNFSQIRNVNDYSPRGPLSLMIRITVGVMLLLAVLWPIDLYEVGKSLASIRHLPALAFCIVAFLDRLLMAYKWSLLLQVRGVSISIWEATRLYFVGHLLGTFTPGAIGADIYRVAGLSRFEKTEIIISTVILERFIGLSVLGVFAALTLPISTTYIQDDSTLLVFIIIGLAALSVLTILASFQPSIVKNVIRRVPYFSQTKIAGRLRSFYLVYSEYRLYSRTLLVFTALTALEVGLLVFNIWLAARSLGIWVSLPYFLSVIPILYLLARLPISFHGIGIAEGLFAYFLIIGGFTAVDGISIALLLRVAELILYFLPAVIMLWFSPIIFHPSTHSIKA